MRNLIATLRSFPKRTSALMMAVIAAVVVPAALLAWGPSDRQTFTMDQPADHVAFNSITDNPVHGDERNFVQIRNYTDNGTFGEQVSLVPGKEYEVYVYYHNNAADNLNDAAHNHKGIANGAFMRTEIPESIPAGSNGRINGFVGATNATPAQVWDEAYAKNDTEGGIALRYTPNSAVIHSNGAIDGQQLDLTKLAGANGALLGYDKLDGKVPGCMEYAGYVTYRFTAVQPDFEIVKQVSISGENDFKETVNVEPGAEVQYKIQYKNTGTVQQDNVTIRDALPKGVSYVAGSTYIANSKTNGQWSAVKEDTITKQGINIGSYAPNGNAYLVFKAKIAAKEKLEKCGVNKLVNVAHAETENGGKSDDATVTVTKDCPEPKDIIVCRLEDKKYPVTIKEEDFDASKHSKNPADCKEESKDIIVCRLEDKKYPVTIKEEDFDASKHSKNPEDCKEKPEVIEVCVIKDKQIKTIDKKDFDKTKHTTDLSKCDDEPKTPPVTPPELPKTGAADSLLNALGLSALVTATAAYVASRKNSLIG